MQCPYSIIQKITYITKFQKKNLNTKNDNNNINNINTNKNNTNKEEWKFNPFTGEKIIK